MLNLQDHPTVQLAEPFDDTHLHNLIAALRIELRERAIAMKSQIPDAGKIGLQVFVVSSTDQTDDDERPQFMASAKLQSGEFLCKARHGSWDLSREALMLDVQRARAFESFKHAIGYVPLAKVEEVEAERIDTSEADERRERRERLEKQHEDIEHFENIA